MKSEYYVYAYLDPRKPGNYVYGDFEFDFEPFYIGKGMGRRLYMHIFPHNIEKDGNRYKMNKIKKILKLGYDLKSEKFVVKISGNLSQKQSLSLERKCIKTIGRIDLKSGPLTNLTNGGDGSYNLSQYTRNKIASSLKGIKPPQLAFDRALKETRKVSDDEVRSIREMYGPSKSKRYSQKELSVKFGVNEHVIHYILLRKTDEMTIKRSKVLNLNEINEIRRLYEPRRITLMDICKKFNLHIDTVHKIITRKSWKDIK